MKAKFLEDGWAGMTGGKIYKVEQNRTDGALFYVTNDRGHVDQFLKCRFRVIDSDVEEKTSEIKETEARLAVLKKELADLKSPKVGQKYLHKLSQSKYILAEGDERFALVCYDGEDSGTIYHLAEDISSVFYGNEDCFKLITE